MGAICKLLEDRATWKSGGNPQNPQYWVKKLFGAQETYTGLDIDEDKALQYSAIWAAVNIISGAVGFLPLIAYRRKGDDKERIADHPVYRLLHDRPNPYMDALVFKETLQAHVLTWGNAFAEIERNGAGQPVWLWPLLPNRTVPKVVDSKVIYEINQTDGSIKYLTYDQVLHIKGLGFDGIKGYSVIRYAANSLSVGMSAEKYGAKFFANNARPGGVLEHPETLGDAAYKRIQENWASEHQGLDNVERVAILEEGMKWNSTGLPPEDAQFLETRKFSVAEVSRWWQIPLHMLSELDKATFSNIEHQGIEFVIWTLSRWLRRWELECNYKLFTTPGKSSGIFYTEFLVAALLRGDTKNRYRAYHTGRQAGFLSINDIRRKENMNLVEGGDTYLEPLNMKPVGEPYTPLASKKGSNLSRHSAMQELVCRTWKRILRKEVGAIRKALQKPETFRSRLDTFYEKHIDYVQEVLEPVLNACCEFVQIDMPLDMLAEEYVSNHRSSISDVPDNDRTQDSIESILTEWETTEATNMSQRLLGGN